MTLQCDNLSGELQDQWSSSTYMEPRQEFRCSARHNCTPGSKVSLRVGIFCSLVSAIIHWISSIFTRNKVKHKSQIAKLAVLELFKEFSVYFTELVVLD